MDLIRRAGEEPRDRPGSHSPRRPALGAGRRSLRVNSGYHQAPRARPHEAPMKKLITKSSATITARMKSHLIAKPTPKSTIASSASKMRRSISSHLLSGGIRARDRGTRAPGVANLGPDEVSELKHVEELPDRMSLLRRVAHLDPRVDEVVVTPTDAPPLDVAGFDEVHEDPLSRPLRDTDVLGEVPQPDVRVVRDPQEHLRMVREERPRRVLLTP